MNLGKLEETAWKRTHPDLKQYLNVGEVHCHLTPHLTYAESADLLGNRFSEQEKISKIVMWMPTKGGNWFAIFVGILKKTTHGTGHRTIVDALQKNLLEVFRENNIAEEEVDSKIKAIFGSTSNTSSMEKEVKPVEENPEKITEDILKKRYKTKEQKIQHLALANDAARFTTRDKLNRKLKEKAMELESYEILIEVVNDIEFMTAICLMNGEIYQCTVCDDFTSSETDYYYGKWGKVKVVIVQTGKDVGSQFLYGSWFETKKALYYMPGLKYVFGVGVCGGVLDAEDPRVPLSHVVVSSHIIGYDHQKKKPVKDESRSYFTYQKQQPFYKYLSQLKNKGTWDIVLHFGQVLSGSWLVADMEAQKVILDPAQKKQLAFEMEGVGIAAACASIRPGDPKVDCLVVKGVSDYANRDKNDEWQPLAARNATCYLSVMINQKFGRPTAGEE